jgi:hypothetical protein
MTPMFLSIVQKGKFSAGTLFLVNALNIVDLPALGSPTIPTESVCDLVIIIAYNITNYRHCLLIFHKHAII